MSKKKDKPIDLNNLTEHEKLKLEIAEEIGGDVITIED